MQPPRITLLEPLREALRVMLRLLKDKTPQHPKYSLAGGSHSLLYESFVTATSHRLCGWCAIYSTAEDLPYELLCGGFASYSIAGDLLCELFTILLAQGMILSDRLRIDSAACAHFTLFAEDLLYELCKCFGVFTIFSWSEK